jgi:hypothetical protein
MAVAETRPVPRTPTSSVAMALDPAVAAPGYGTVSADFNGDGKMDLATTNSKAGGLTIRLGKGDGTFLPAVNYRIGYYYNAIVAGDFNGDGKVDLAVSLPTLCGGCGGFPTYQLQVFLGAGDGTFTNVAPKYPFAGLPLAAGDFNGDGKLDLIVTNTDYYGDSWVAQIMLGKGDGTFEKGVDLVDTFWPTFPAVGDFNSDGKLDIALPALDNCCGSGNPITYVFLGNGDGTFATPAQYAPSQNWAVSAAVADVNGDGKLDIITDGVQVLLNNGDGTFTNDASVNVRGSSSIGGVVVGDFNGDGNMDFATGASYVAPYSSFIFLGNGGGTFQMVTVAGSEVSQAADFNQDGKLDLLTTSGIFLQTPAGLSTVYVDFGEVAINAHSTPQTVTLTNVGTTLMTIKSLQLTGASFSETTNCSGALAAGKSCEIKIVFTPTALQDYTATLSVTVPGAPPSTVALTGYGY